MSFEPGEEKEGLMDGDSVDEGNDELISMRSDKSTYQVHTMCGRTCRKYPSW